MKRLMFLLLTASAPMIGADKQYSQGTIVDVQTQAETYTITRSMPQSRDAVIVTIALGGYKYAGFCGYAHWLGSINPSELTVGDPIQIRLNQKQDKFWIVRPNGKERDCKVRRKEREQIEEQE